MVASVRAPANDEHRQVAGYFDGLVDDRMLRLLRVAGRLRGDLRLRRIGAGQVSVIHLLPVETAQTFQPPGIQPFHLKRPLPGLGRSLACFGLLGQCYLHQPP